MTGFRKTLSFILTTLVISAPLIPNAMVFAFGPATLASAETLATFCEPAISPDRSEIAFVSGGDIWAVPASGGEARLLVSHPATESRPLYSPDRAKLAFVSNRSGNGDIYVLAFETGELRRLTFDDGLDQLDAWSRDGRWLYFSTTSRDISGMNDVYRISDGGGTPMSVSADAYMNEFFAAPSPDGSKLALTARGVASGQWWRKGHSHLDESEIWLARPGATPTFELLVGGGGKNMWPMWTPDGRDLFFVSDRNGAENIWSKKAGAEPRQITGYKDGRLLWPTISYDGRVIVFERNFGIWKLDTATNEAAEVRIIRRGAPAGQGVEHLRITDQMREMQLSPDGKKIAFVAHGEVFAASAKDGGDATRVSHSSALEYDVAWAPDSRRLAYVSDRDGPPHIYLYDFASNVEERLTQENAGDASPQFSPDGKSLAFVRDGREVRYLEIESKQARLLTAIQAQRAPFGSRRLFVWSPDSKWVAFVSAGSKSFRNVQVVAATGGEPRQMSFIANVFSGAVSWSPDGSFVLFDTGQRTESGQIARVDLVPRPPRFREDQFRDLFKEETPRNLAPRTAQPADQPESRPAQSDAQPDSTAPQQSGQQRKPAPKAVNIVFDEIRQRLSLLPIGLDVNTHSLSPDGKSIVMVASAAGQQNLYVYSLDDLARDPAVARQLTSTAGFKSDVQFSPDGKDVYYIERGRISAVSIESRQPRQIAITAELDVDFSQEKMEVFSQGWTYLRDHFYDPGYHGADWQAVRQRYEPRIRGASTADEVRRLMQLMVGELNASHCGVSAPAGLPQPVAGKLGLRFDRVEYEKTGHLRVTEVIPLGPAALAGQIKAGDYLLAVDGQEIDSRANLDELLAHKVGRRVALSVASAADGSGKREIATRPVTTATEKGLLYRRWVEEKRDYVARVSGGRLGYVHLFDMSGNSLSQLYIDLDAENHSREGVLIDVRNNNGGFVNAYALDVISRRPYLSMTPRGARTAPARTMLGQRALESPTILITNQHSLSDAEDFSEGYRSLKLGKIVGEPTGGWIIYTTNVPLIDGSTIRLPFIKITANDGTVMELNPRPVDIPVKRPLGEAYTGRDSQLDAAVNELLKQIGGRVNGSR